MRRLFSILAMVAVLAFVGCEKHGKGGKGIAKLSGQWVSLEEKVLMEGLASGVLHIDINESQPGKCLVFVVVSKTWSESVTVGDAELVSSYDCELLYDTNGNLFFYVNDDEVEYDYIDGKYLRLTYPFNDEKYIFAPVKERYTIEDNIR